MINLPALKSIKSLQVFFITVILLFVLFRYLFLGANFSQFIVAGDDFVNKDTVAESTIIHKGQGYDGQFFYRYAHHPLNKEKIAFGITVDHIEYRIQRIVYPATVWLFSLVSSKSSIPFLMVLTNFLAFLALFYICLKFCTFNKVNPQYALLPLFLYGGYMSLARDTSELFEVLFFVMAIYAIAVNNLLLYATAISLSIFSRETSLVAIAPLTVLYALSILKPKLLSVKNLLNLALLSLPFLAIILWKYYLHTSIQSDHLVDGSQNLSWPLNGIYLGLMTSLNFSNIIDSLESVFWILYLSWNIWFAFIVIKDIKFKSLLHLNLLSILQLVFLFWTIFSLVLGHAIYIDDWGFVRVFTLFNMLGFLIIMLLNKGLNRYFLNFSTILLLLTIIRLVVRV